MTKKRLYEVSLGLMTNLENEAKTEKNTETKIAILSLMEEVRKTTYALQQMYIQEVIKTKSK